MNLQDIEQSLKQSMLAKDSLRTEVLRALKTRVINAKVAHNGTEPSEAEILALVRSESKRRKESADSFIAGGRQDLADKELAENVILESFLPAGPSRDVVVAEVQKILETGTFTKADFGKVMAQLKAHFPDADGGLLSGVLKEHLQ